MNTSSRLLQIFFIQSIVLSSALKLTNDPMPPSSAWMIRERNYGLTCVIIQFSAVFEIKYLSHNFTFKTARLVVKPDAVFSSQSNHGRSCLTDSRGFIHFDLQFDSGSPGNVIDDNDLMFFFEKQDDSYELLGLTLQYTLNNQTFPDHIFDEGTVMLATITFNGEEFVIPRGMSYSCMSRREIKFDGIDDVSLVLQDFTFEAFTFQIKPIFSPSVSCRMDSTLHAYDWAEVLICLGIVLIFLSCVSACFVVCRRWRNLSRSSSSTSITPILSKQVAFNISEKV